MSLRGKAAKGTLWVVGGSYSAQIVNFVSNILLMRIIAPDQFGIMALAMFFLVFAQKLGGFGFNHALIHKQDELDSAVPTHQFLHLAMSGVVLLLLVASYPLIKAGYDALTASVILFLAFSNIAQSMGHTPRILMEKELEFSPVMKVNITSTVISNLVGIVFAFYGLGVWALALRQLSAEIISTTGFFILSGKKPKLKIDGKMIKWYFKFGSYLWIAGIATLITLKFDDFLVGTMISSEQLGFYARAYAFACLPTTMIAHLVAKVAFPLYSKLQDDNDKLGDTFETVTGGVLIFTLPAAVGLALLAPEFVSILFGEKWMPMVPMLRWLLIYASLRPLFDNTGELFTAMGKPKIAGLIQMSQAGVVLFLCPVLVWKFGAVGAAVTVGLAMGIGVILAYRKLVQYVNISLTKIFVAPVLASLVATIIALGAATHTPLESDVSRFFFKGIIFTVVFIAVLFVLQRKTLIENGRRFIKSAKTSSDD